jgi:1-acyl-sn-glycerol-3-phosphate acyltransferase
MPGPHLDEPYARPWSLLARGVAARLGRLLLAPRVEGAFHLPPPGAGAILACKHDSYLDALLVTNLSARPVRFMGAVGWLRLPVIGWTLRLNGVFPIHRGRGDRGTVARAGKLARDGALVGIFPEGTLVRGRLIGPLRRGSARIALEAGVPVIPVALGLRRGRGRSFVIAGEPIAAGGTAVELTARIADALQRLQDAGHRGAPTP